MKELNEYGICVNDTEYSSLGVSNDVKLLLGADVAGKLFTGNVKCLIEGPVAVESHLGWTLMGKIPINDIAVTTNSSLSLLLTEASVNQLWSLDVLGITDPSAKKVQAELQRATQEYFLETIRLDVENRFVVSMPWLEDHPPLPTNYDLAYKRLNSTVNRLKSQSIYKEYEQVFNEWMEEGIIEEVKDNCEENVHYLPHRAVIKPNSTTKIRPVFDASAKAKGFPSLNDCLEKGENLIELIPSILMRFRTERIGVVSDIRKAFLQIGLTETDRNYLRFLWLSDTGLKIYRHCRVVFGVTCSPFLLSSTIKYLLMNVLKEIREQKATYPEYVVQKLMKSFYVDNCVTSVKDTEELNMFERVATEIMASRKFDLRGWEYTDLTEENSQPPTNVLGMSWDKKYDTLQVSTGCIKELNIEKVTKRTILSAAHRLFDPLGMICPVTLIPKLLLQSIWKLKLNWDDDVDENTRREFLKWIEGVLHIEKINIPRYFGLSGSKKCSIYLPQELWTSSEYVVNEEEVNCEKRKGVTTSMINFEVTKLLSSNISDNRKSVHTMVWVTRFLFNFKNEERRKGDLSVRELEEAEKITVYLIQQESFTRVSDESLKTLDVFIGEKGICRLKTTVYKSNDFEEFRTPAVLQGEHAIVKRLILSEYKKRGHADVSNLLNFLGERFWLLRGRGKVKSVSRPCVVCKRSSTKLVDPPTASPPSERAQDAEVFQVTGVDLAGPVILKDNPKGWICIFTCAVYFTGSGQAVKKA
ncbi:uncharacterized protein [Parasteatoda tepidariorum]|uniref:uncharacterized protein n=1 Tax=Parasteatoda tepidariorum TaxID=114398 RepID=UPI001C723F3D|nr:uncharacterized protein LOC122269646 [Parasteatoda tepidariorum]